MFGIVNTLIKNNTHSIYSFFGLAILLALSACNSGNSGPCEWHPEELVRMDVIEIESIDETGENYEVWLEFNKSILAKEPQRLSELRNHSISKEFIEVNNISTNITFIGNVTELKSGDCDPYYLSFNFGFKNP